MRAGGKAAGRCVCSGGDGSAVFKCWKNAVAVSQFLRTSHAAYPQPACNLGAEKLAAVPPDLQYIVEIHPGTASVVPLRSGGKNESERFDIPFNRQQLADYLGVDRSALSAELGKMQREGLLEFRKNHFHLYEEVRSL